MGDSIADDLARGLQRIEGDLLTTINGGVPGCGIGRGEIQMFEGGEWTPSMCPNWTADWQTMIDHYDPKLVVINSGFWETFDRRVDGEVLPFGSPDNDASLLATYERVVEVLGSRGARIVWLAVPCFAPAPYNGVSYDYADWKTQHINALYAELIADHPQTTLLDYRPWVCPGNQYAQVLNGVVIRADDGVHFTPVGAEYVAAGLLPQLVQFTG